MGNIKGNIIGIWDTTSADNKLGSLLLFQEELLLLSEINKTEKINIIFTYNNKDNLLHFYSYILQLNQRIHHIFYVKNSDFFRVLNFEKIKSHTIIWPTDEWKERCSYIGSTLAIQDLWRKSGKIINLKTPKKALRKAARWLHERIDERLPVVIHLRINHEEQVGNTHIPAWASFFQYCMDKGYPLIFIIIGNDPIDERLLNCKNVIMVSESVQSIELDLALIEIGFLFMGMASGPCNMAILSDKPYLIWKHPNHHADQIISELNDLQQFPFAIKNQKFMRDWDTTDSLIKEFENIYSNPDINYWKERFKRYLYDI